MSDDPDSPNEDDRTDGPPDPQLDPTRSPGFGDGPPEISEIDVGRDVTLGEATPEELTASDTSRVASESVETLLEHVTDGTVVERRRAALALAEKERTDRIVTTLADAARVDDDADVRQFAVEALGKLGGDPADRVARTATRDPNPWVRAEAVVALDRLDRSTHTETIEKALDDEHHAVRRNAAISTFKHRGEGAIDVLLEQIEDPSDRVREWAAHMLGGVDDGRARAALQEALDDENRIVRATAERALDVDPDRFRRRFTGGLDEKETTLRGEDPLNRQPDL